MVVLASALRAGLSERRARELTDCIGVPRRTLERWRAWWLDEFVEGAFWNNARARFMPPLAAGALPAALLERFGGPGLASQLVATLRFLAPLHEGR